MASYSFINFIFLFLLYSLHVIATVHTIMPPAVMLCHDHERSALLHFKQSLSLNESASGDSSAYSKTESWKARGENGTDCCSWHGVECDEKTGYIIGLHLNSAFLYGILGSNSTIFTLVHLQTLNLADNDFQSSTIPHEISHLSSLSRLDLSFSGFSGPIPTKLSKLFKLAYLDLSGNYLSGIFPVDIFHLPHMLVLDVGDNENLTGVLPEFNRTSSFKELRLSFTKFSGKLPISIGNLQSLTGLRLKACNFSGPIPTSITNLTQLTLLSLSYNKFSGHLPISVGNLQSLAILNLNDCYFSGLFPTSIANLTQLTYLSLSSNNFSKSRKISWLDNLTKLTYLDLNSSNIHGDIPSSLANLTQLAYLYLDSNYFTGEIPVCLTNMTHLIELSLSNNELTGPILSSFSQLENLEVLDLSGNNLIGTVEADIFFTHKKLEFLSLSDNNITFITHHHINFTIPTLRGLQLNGCNLREIPYFLKLKNNLEFLFLHENNIHGKIPYWIWNVSDNLEAVDLSSNFLTSIEHNLTVFSNKSLEVIDIGNNMLQGNLPVPPPNTIRYIVSNNSLTGDIPPLICSGMSLKVLDLSYNNMSGPIPPCLSNSLASLSLQSNKFSGTIPQLYSEDCDLEEIDLSQNQLKGEVPRSLISCKMLQILDLSDNQIEQTFPVWLGTLPQLQVLFLHSNKFHGALGSPRSPLEFPMLRIIDVSHNSLTGVLPVEYIKIWNAMKMNSPDTELYITTNIKFKTRSSIWGNPDLQSSITLVNKGVETEYKQILNILTAIDLSSNNFTGEIPESLGTLKELELLNLSNNELTGPIPRSLANLTKLESLDLSQNKLTGVIPQQLASQLTSLEFFNVSYNLLSGHIPQGSQFGTFDNNSYVGNSGLFGFPISKNCGTVHSPPADGDEGDSDDTYEFPSGFDWMFILAGVGSGLVVGYVMGNILTDGYPWLISSIAQSFACREKKQRRAKRSIIRR
ncbi:hypothetical protein DCAR_0625236 [Daucus carota subsp. sativus]|uniref:Leucine-rich repeat-containing N-terminal plant-type domain-containing protein n=1 Tax=Daucus carota subsp. sativus TaxID=79200 RepID=A0AAF0XDI0_DAUCS|nr:PREDICTED: receptor-like protein 12 [Daucus carota subsp. sativus]XP_017254427.1 PREDICTED: receptor-like protein 12 [Daucus carota subsp. sativus]WOH05815.1 hypothetical protein DCAR_0625236 [Daucus carota subsp. sativus]